jgi:hypothetical protein
LIFWREIVQAAQEVRQVSSRPVPLAISQCLPEGDLQFPVLNGEREDPNAWLPQ